MTQHFDSIVVGAGQAGLVMSHFLSQLGRDHIVLERHKIGERWQSERWDGLRFQYPNWSLRLPDKNTVERIRTAMPRTRKYIAF